MYYNRSLKDVWLDASGQFPVLLLTGPRQVGKTTFLRNICTADRNYVTLDDPATRAAANEDPALFMKRFEPPLLIDEIQYAPGLMPYIKMIVDDDRKPGMFWLTGSQQFLMMKDISETLAGRVGIINLLGFSQRERSGDHLDIEPFLPDPEKLRARLTYSTAPDMKAFYEQIWLGSFPALVSGEISNRNLFYSSYLQTYLQRDVRDLTQVGDQNAFLKFIRACAARTAQLLNMADIARDTDVSIPTVKKWLSILQASFQIRLLQPFYTNMTKRAVKTPKLYFLDTGLCSYLTEWETPDTLEAGAMSGQIFETYVYSEILKSYLHRGIEPTMWYYRDKDRKEIDFLLEQNQTLYPVETKKSAMPRKEWIGSFSILERLKMRIGHGAVVCMIEKSLPIDKNIDALPVTVF
ncbi:MAG TPA: ATP-binding protein [Acidobacteriota bacterium]|nr:ATP-binding protein [Acidobacteriota bacterium]